MQLILSLVLLSACSYLGYSFGQYYHLREQFLLDLITFCQHLKSEIGFAKNSLVQIVKNSETHYHPAMKQVLKNYVKCLNNEATIDLETLKKHLHTIYLEEKEHHELLQFFNSLGKTDRAHQLQTIEQFLVFFYNFLNNAEVQKKKYSGMFSKLGFLTGIFLVILLL
jgi:stage III sporulation protein AB